MTFSRVGSWMGRAAIAALLVGTMAAQGWAGDESVGTTSANFLKIPAHARPAAMGEAFTAVSDDESALLYNPAGTARVLRHQISATHIEWFQGILLEHLGGVASLGPAGSFGLGITWLQVDPLVRTQRTGNGPDPLANFKELGTFKPYDMAIEGTWAWQGGSHWNLGLGTKIVQQSIDDKAGWGVNVDAGLQRTSLWDWLDAGLLVQNLGSAINVGGTPFQQPLAFKAGLAGRFFEKRLTVSTDVTVPTDNSVIPAAGVEWWVAQPLALRGGWRGGYAGQPTAGMGFRFSIFQLDYAWQPYVELGVTHRLTATLAFGQPGTDVTSMRPLIGPIGEEAWRRGGFKLLPARPDAVTSWKLSLIDADGSVARSFEGSGTAPEALGWDGRDSKGQVLPDGIVTAKLDVNYEGGLQASASGAKVELDSTPPTVHAGIEPIIARPNSQGAVLIPARVDIQAQDKHGIGGWKLEIRDKAGAIFRNFSGDGQPPQPLVWDGTDGNGRFVDSGSTYYFWPFAKDSLGNWGKGDPNALIVLLKEIHFDIASDALFEPGKADVRISAYHQLTGVKDLILKNHQAGTVVDIVGHTDNEPTVHSKYPNNQALSLARAQAVVKFLTTLLEMDPAILDAKGAGDSKPKATNDTAEGRLANRRVEVVIHAKEYR